jgi:hypothetical protein
MVTYLWMPLQGVRFVGSQVYESVYSLFLIVCHISQECLSNAGIRQGLLDFMRFAINVSSQLSKSSSFWLP